MINMYILTKSSFQTISNKYRGKPDEECLRFATANVCTLQPQELSSAVIDGPNLFGAGRISLMEKQFINAELDVIGLQESRCRGDTTLHGEHYKMYRSSAKQDGAGGVQCWLPGAS